MEKINLTVNGHKKEFFKDSKLSDILFSFFSHDAEFAVSRNAELIICGFSSVKLNNDDILEIISYKQDAGENLLINRQINGEEAA